ncbi:MAG: TlpA family protein disulfide reductase [Planctomycetes bacterium]|nr:TlpA family protein disulfide reductase [Planctomycetota bacterium]
MYPHERSLVQRLAGKPFVLIGVNSDKDREKIKKDIASENITWRSFWNGEKGTQGPISAEWGVRGWPTMYVLDAQGRIRYKSVGSPGNETLDKWIEGLVEEAEKGAAGN